MFSGELAFGQERPGGSQPKDDAGPQLRLSLSKTEFHCGEVIPLDLAFTAEGPDRYQISLASYDRSGRMSHDQFLIDPKEGTSDPVQLYFNSGWVFLGGGLFSVKFLSTSPTFIPLDLNEWVRFDQPGAYRLTVVSYRVNDTRASDYPRNAGRELKSNSVDLRIIASDAAWQQAQLKQIVEALGRPGPSGGDRQNDPRQAAMKALRYLGSEEAAGELARRLRGEDSHADWDCMFGLIGSPHRDAGLMEMNKLLEDPEFPVSDLFLTTMSVLPLDSNEPPESLRKQREEILQALRQRLASALSNKHGKALAVSLDTAMSGNNSKMPPDIKGKLVPQLIETFSALAVEKQVAWLEYRWKDVAGPAWLPVVRALALHYEDFPELRAMPAYQSLQLSAAALKRWYELDPEGARGAVITEITRPKPRYNANTLGLLPDQTLPDVEHVIAEHLLATDNYEIEGNLASLLFRYADGAVLRDVLREFKKKEGNWAGDTLYQLLAYLLKVDPQTARPLLEREAAVRCPPGRGCAYVVFATIGGLQNSPILEELALKTLLDPDPSAVIDAVNYLGKYGSPNAEQALWSRYDAWSREWSGRADELRFVAAGKNPHVWDANLGQSLARALASGTNWFCDESKLRRIQALGVGANIQGDTEQALRAWSQRPFTITYYGNIPPTFALAQYNPLSLDLLKKKLTQFPAGTKFVLSPSNPSPSPDELKIRDEIFQFAAKNGITLMCAR
jgi:hypothetical protein